MVLSFVEPSQNADSRDNGGYSLLRDAASAERQAYAKMASALESDGEGVNGRAVRELREELEKVALRLGIPVTDEIWTNTLWVLSSLVLMPLNVT